MKPKPRKPAKARCRECERLQLRWDESTQVVLDNRVEIARLEAAVEQARAEGWALALETAARYVDDIHWQSTDPHSVAFNIRDLAAITIWEGKRP